MITQISSSNIKSHVLQTNFLVNVILQCDLVLELFVAILARVDRRLGMLDDHVPAEAEGVSRHFPTQLATVVLAVVLGVNATLKKLHHSNSA